MPLERRNGCIYYYQKQRNGQRVTSRYVGSGEIAKLAALVDHAAQTEREQERAALAQARHEVQAFDQHIVPAFDAVRSLIGELLPLAGFYQHKGTWRKYGMTATTPPTMKELRTIFERVDRGEPAALVEVRKIFAAFPDRCRDVTNSLVQATSHIVATAPASSLAREAFTAGVVQLRTNLHYDDAPAVERLVIDAVVLAWLRLALVEQQYTNILNQEHTLTLGLFWERRLSAAQGRYLRAVESLARVRRLAVPAIIQNIAANQIVQVGGQYGQ